MARYCELPEEEAFSWVWTAGREVLGEYGREAGYAGRGAERRLEWLERREVSLQKSKGTPSGRGRVLLMSELDMEGTGELLQGFTEQRPGPGIAVMAELPGCGEGTRKERGRCQMRSL